MKRALLLAALGFSVWAPSAAALPPTVTPLVTGQVGDNGWYVGNVIVNWSITPPGYSVDFGCAPSTSITTDTTGKKVECQASIAGDAAYSSVTIRLDKTPPSTVANADRAADVGGYYNHPFTVAWAGADPTSGVVSCTSLPYGGPDGSSISLAGTCRDKAGNVSAPVPFGFNYDATPPALANLAANAEDRSVILSWQSAGATRITVTRIAGGARAAQVEVVYDGTGSNFTDTGLTNGARYTYTVRAVDAAANAATASINVTPSAAAASQPLLSPPPQAKVKRPPLLRWRPVWKASYYNLQIFRKGKKILSVWPRKAHYQLRSEWRYRGHKQRLGKATYRWYIWPGYGRRNQHRYGKLLGRRSFTIT